jgi:hypothetical protein
MVESSPKHLNIEKGFVELFLFFALEEEGSSLFIAITYS